MEQHHKISIEETVEADQAKAPVKPVAAENLLPASILVAAILLSASMFYNTKLVLKKLDSGLLTAGTQVAGSVGNAGNDDPAAPIAPSGPVDVSKRDDAPVLGNKNA